KSRLKLAWRCCIFRMSTSTPPTDAQRLTPDDAGSGRSQEAMIRIGNACGEGKVSQGSPEAYGGHAYYRSDWSIRLDGSVSDNLIPIPLDVHGDIELTLECWGDVVRVHGNSARLELIGTAESVEGFHPGE